MSDQLNPPNENDLLRQLKILIKQDTADLFLSYNSSLKDKYLNCFNETLLRIIRSQDYNIENSYNIFKQWVLWRLKYRADYI